jgi:thioredoxin reductase
MPSNVTPCDLAIVGGGPAGLAATAYALHAQLDVALIAPDLGGKVNYSFALRDMPQQDTVWGASLARELEQKVRDGLKRHIVQSVAAITQQEGGGFTLRLEDGTELIARAVVVATGARPQRLYIPGESEYFLRGVSFSAISHGPFFQDRAVAVIGDGARAVDAVLELIPLARRVFFVVPRQESVERAPGAARALGHPKVHVFRNWEVQQIEGDEFVTGLDLVGSNGEIRTLEVEGVFVQMGLLPANALVRELVALDEHGHVVIDERCRTSLPGLFAAGDVTNVHAEQVPISIGEGAKAALSAWDYLAETANS